MGKACEFLDAATVDDDLNARVSDDAAGDRDTRGRSSNADLRIAQMSEVVAMGIEEPHAKRKYDATSDPAPRGETRPVRRRLRQHIELTPVKQYKGGHRRAREHFGLSAVLEFNSGPSSHRLTSSGHSFTRRCWQRSTERRPATRRSTR